MSKFELPTFQAFSFSFGKSSTPEHIEAYPDVPTYVGKFTVFACATGGETYPLAIDVPTEEMALMLGYARTAKQEATIDLYGYTDSICILYPGGDNERIYTGRLA